MCLSVPLKPFPTSNTFFWWTHPTSNTEMRSYNVKHVFTHAEDFNIWDISVYQLQVTSWKLQFMHVFGKSLSILWLWSTFLLKILLWYWRRQEFYTRLLILSCVVKPCTIILCQIRQESTSLVCGCVWSSTRLTLITRGLSFCHPWCEHMWQNLVTPCSPPQNYTPIHMHITPSAALYMSLAACPYSVTQGSRVRV